MIDPPGYREAMDAIEAATPEERAKIAAMQARADRSREAFDHIVHTAEPDPEELRNTLLANLSIRAPTNMENLGLAWMQRLPGAWPGWYPEYCQRVAEFTGTGEAA